MQSEEILKENTRVRRKERTVIVRVSDSISVSVRQIEGIDPRKIMVYGKGGSSGTDTTKRLPTGPNTLVMGSTE